MDPQDWRLKNLINLSSFTTYFLNVEHLFLGRDGFVGDEKGTSTHQYENRFRSLCEPLHVNLFSLFILITQKERTERELSWCSDSYWKTGPFWKLCCMEHENHTRAQRLSGQIKAISIHWLLKTCDHLSPMSQFCLYIVVSSEIHLHFFPSYSRQLCYLFQWPCSCRHCAIRGGNSVSQGKIRACGKRERQKLSESRCLKVMPFTVSRAEYVSLQLELNKYPWVNRN